MYDDKKIKPCVYCFKAILDTLCKEGQIDESLSLFHDMINRGVLSSVFTYNSLIHGLRKFGDREVAKRFLIDMLDNGLSFDMHTYSALIDFLRKEERTQEAELIFGLMIKKKAYSLIFSCKALCFLFSANQVDLKKPHNS
ncbi:Pentatricopeptide repeat [Parasponia andersonii]|uniref:Pentatricopeptide repeat n=1 Tax=Parasponia andersonii TaxID=3476 RepID=A0A2P5CDQ5_PARAD|nr:Pentatricopeptide repeat [Parasponia andersonii]